jgi:YbbR domain-containing protein
MSAGRTVRRAAAFIVHNWPLKLAAIVVATLLYAGLVVSQDSNVYPGSIPVSLVNQPDRTIVTNELRNVDQIRYIAPADAGRLTAGDFRVTVDLANVKPDAIPVSVTVNVEPIDPRVTVLEVHPRTIQVVLDQLIPKVLDVTVDRGTPPPGLDVGQMVVSPPQVTVTGPSAVVNRVVAVRASVLIDTSGIHIDRDVVPEPIDASGQIVSGVNMDPRTVHITIPIYTNKQSRTLPVNVIVTGTPAAGFQVASIEVTPLVVSVEGNEAQLVQLNQADTQPVSVLGATGDIDTVVSLALPTGVTLLGAGTINVIVRITPVTETRTYSAGVRLDGAQPGLDYAVSPDRVLLTLFGSVVDLDRLSSVPLVVGLNVATLGPGTHAVPVVPSLPTGVSVAAQSPSTVAVTILVPATPTPAPSSPPASPSSPPASPSSPPASPSASPSAAP